MSRGATPTAIDVAIVNWNTSGAALDAARAYTRSEGVATRVTIVDNSSSAEQRERLERDCPDSVHLDLADDNLGYGSAANRALAGGSGSLVCVSNADLRPEPGALADLAAAVGPGVGMVGPAFDDEGDRYHAELPGAIALVGQFFAGSFMRRPVASPPPGELLEIGQPSGACFLMRRDAWKRIGGFDEGFFLWYEDVDLARRLRDAGLRNLVVGSARASHAAAGSFRQLDEATMQRIRIGSLRRYIEKHHRGLAPLAGPLAAVALRSRATGRRGGQGP